MPTNFKLGKLPHVHDDRTLKFSKYLTPALPPIPESYSYFKTDKIKDWGMMKNDVYGCCVWSALGHMIMSWTADNGKMFRPSDADILQGYSSTGFNPLTGSGDNGTDELQALKYMQSTGLAGHKIGAFVSVNPKDVREIKTAIYLFGASLIGVELPLIAQNQLAWRIPPMSFTGQDTAVGSWGGHGIPDFGFDYFGSYIVTWGGILFQDWNFATTYNDERWAMISPDYFNGNKQSPLGFNMDMLQEDLYAIQKS